MPLPKALRKYTTSSVPVSVRGRPLPLPFGHQKLASQHLLTCLTQATSERWLGPATGVVRPRRWARGLSELFGVKATLKQLKIQVLRHSSLSKKGK